MIVQTATSVPLTLTVSRDGEGSVAGLTTTVAVRRVSDGYYLDWNDATFKNSGWTTKSGALTDRGGGIYERSLSVTSAAGTVLVAEYACTSTGYEGAATETLQVVAALNDVPGEVWDETAASHVSAGSLGELLTKLRKIHTNKMIETAGSPGTLIVYDDDGTTPFITYQITDPSGGAVTAQAGAPARRAAGT